MTEIEQIKEAIKTLNQQLVIAKKYILFLEWSVVIVCITIMMLHGGK